MSGEVHKTTDHDVIRRWAEERGGQPAEVEATGERDDPGILRIDFPEVGGGSELEPIEWDDFFRKFEEKGLAMVYQETLKDGQTSRFSKLIYRDS